MMLTTATIATALLMAQAQAPFLSAQEVTGSYYHGDGRGFNSHLELRADRSFDFKFRGCRGTYASSQGSWAWDDNVLVLTPVIEEADNELKRVARRLVPARLGERIYLVETSEVTDFVRGIKTEHRVPELRRSDHYLKTSQQGGIPEADSNDRLVLPPGFGG